MRAKSRLSRWLALALLVGGVTLFFGLRGVQPLQAAPAKAPPAPKAGTPGDLIPFDHSLHVGKYGMQCLGCHVDARISTTAGIPSVRKCMGCHKFVSKDKPAIQTLAKLWDEGKSPSFRRIHDLPDYVYFSHRVHIAAQVDCKSCHGDVGKMARVVQVSPLTMGWCLECHKQRKATTDCIGCHK